MNAVLDQEKLVCYPRIGFPLGSEKSLREREARAEIASLVALGFGLSLLFYYIVLTLTILNTYDGLTFGYVVCFLLLMTNLVWLYIWSSVTLGAVEKELWYYRTVSQGMVVQLLQTDEQGNAQLGINIEGHNRLNQVRHQVRRVDSVEEWQSYRVGQYVDFN